MKLSKDACDASAGKARCLPGGTGFLIVMLLLLVGLMAGVYFKVQRDQETAGSDDQAAVPEKAEVAEVVRGELMKADDKPKVTPKEKPVAVPEPVAPAPAPPVVKKKTEVDLLLEKHFPLPTFQPLEEIVKQWTEIPKRAMPGKVLVKVGVAYSDKENNALESEAANHYAVPMKMADGVVTLGYVDDPRMHAQVKLAETNLKALVTQLYEDKKHEAEARVLAKREANREKAVAYLAKLKEQGKEAKEDDGKEIAQVNDKDRDDGDFSAKRYGRRFRGDFWPSPKNGKNSKYDHEMPMGPLCGVMSVLYDKREAKIISLWKKGPGARAGLEEGDVLVKVDGKLFSEYGKSAGAGAKGVPEQLGMAMLEAQASQRPVVVTVERGGERVDVSVELPAAPAFTDDFPKDCPRSQALSKAAAEYLLEHQGSDGKWRANDYTNAWCGLALLASGEKKYARDIKKLARTMADKYDLGSNPSDGELIEGGDGHGAASNWFVCITGMFLAEYYLATGDKAVLDAIEHCCRSMDIRIHPGNGRFGHSRDQHHLPYGGKGLVIINVHAHLMWGLEAQIDGMSGYDWSVWDKSYNKAVEPSFGGDGGVGYNFSARGGSQSTPRTGAMLTALKLVGKNKSDARKMSGWLADNRQVFPNVHAMTFIGPIYGFMGLKNTSTRHYRKAMDDYQWMFSLVQPANYSHGAYYYSDRGNSGGDGYCNKRLVGNVMALMVLNSHRDNTLWMYGNRERNWFKK